MSKYYAVVRSTDHLAHYGVKGMKWGVRKYVKENGSLTTRGKLRYGGTKEAKAVKQSLRENKSFDKQYNQAKKNLITKMRKKDPLSVNKLADDYVTKGLRIPKKDPVNAEIADYYKSAYRSLAQDATGFSLGKKWQRQSSKARQKLNANKDKQARMIMQDLKKRGYDKDREGRYHAEKMISDGYPRSKFNENNGSVFAKEGRHDHRTLQLWQNLSEAERKNNRKTKRKKVIT